MPIRTLVAKDSADKPWYQNKQSTKDIILSSELNFLSELKQMKGTYTVLRTKIEEVIQQTFRF